MHVSVSHVYMVNTSNQCTDLYHFPVHAMASDPTNFLVLMQTAFVISVCNNQLLELIENELIWVLGHIPGLSSVLPSLVANLHKIQESYLAAPVPAPSSTKVRTIVLLVKSCYIPR